MPDGLFKSDIEPVRVRRRTGYPSEALVRLPGDERELLKTAMGLVDICRDGVGRRLEYYRFLNMVSESGRKDGTKSLINLLYTVLDRLASMLFSPTDIRFSIDFENPYDKRITAIAERTTRLLAHSWENTNTDLLFAKGVFEALRYGLMIMKQKADTPAPKHLPFYSSYLVNPWQFGVYRPDMPNLENQACMVETTPLTMPELWRRISGLPDARKLYDQIEATAAPGRGSEVANNFNHPVLFANQIQLTQPQRVLGGGVVGINSATQYDGLKAELAAPSILFHEIWVWDEDDYTTIEVVQAGGSHGGGDILIAPRVKKSNLLISGYSTGLHPYTMIQPNSLASNIWGRSELTDLFELQEWLSMTSDDTKKAFGLLIDKILAFKGDGLTDEQYGQFRQAGYTNLGQTGDVKDLTPAFPPEAIALLDKIIQFMEMISGFDNLLSGKGEPGVRSGVQANPMMRTAGARLRDRSLEVERQCAQAADLRLSLMQFKDPRYYWTDPDHPEETKFTLGVLPEDARVTIDGHTTSPVFADEHQQLIVAGLKLGIMDKQSAIEALPFQNKDTILQRIKEQAEQQQQMLANLQRTDPEGFAKAVEKGLSHGSGRR